SLPSTTTVTPISYFLFFTFSPSRNSTSTDKSTFHSIPSDRQLSFPIGALSSIPNSSVTSSGFTIHHSHSTPSHSPELKMYWHVPFPVLPALSPLPVTPFVTTLALPPSSRTDQQRPKHHDRSPENNPSTGTATSSTSLGGIQVTTTVTLTYSPRDETKFPYPILRFPSSPNDHHNRSHKPTENPSSSAATRSWTAQPTPRNWRTGLHLPSSDPEHDNDLQVALSRWPTTTTTSTTPITQPADSEPAPYPPPPALLDPDFTPRSCAWRYYQLLLLSPQLDQSPSFSSSAAGSEFPFPAAFRTNSLSCWESVMALVVGVIAMLGRWGRIVVLRVVLWEMERNWMEWGGGERVEEV
ncbi:hypothetical protein EX30DRAFT_383716, partial [Ascodesmis nigricans]